MLSVLPPGGLAQGRRGTGSLRGLRWSTALDVGFAGFGHNAPAALGVPAPAIFGFVDSDFKHSF